MKIPLRIFIFFISIFLLSSCYKAGPDFHPPPAPVKCEWIDGESEKIEFSDAYVCYWWQTFNDPVLDHLVMTAYEQNLSLKIACYRIMEARARLGITVGEFFPQVQEAFGLADRTKLSKHQANIGSTPDIYFKDYQLGFQVAWELDFWGKFRRGIESQQAALWSSIANYDDVLVLLLSDVANVYVGIRITQERIRIVKNNIKLQERSLEITQANFEGGFVSELDVQQATTLLRGTEARLPDLEKEVRQFENALSVLLGMPPTDLSCMFKGNEKIPSVPNEILVSMPECLLYRRPDIRRALYAAAAQSARIGIAYSDFFPQVSLTGMIALRSSDSVTNPNMSPGNLFDRDSLTFNYGANFVWPLLNYGRIYNRVQVERALFYQLATNYQNTVLQAYQDVEDSLVAYLKSQEQEKILLESVIAARRSVDLANTQYIEGLADYTRVLNTQESQLQEEEKHAIIRGNIAFGLIATYKALGGGWELKEGCKE